MDLFSIFIIRMSSHRGYKIFSKSQRYKPMVLAMEASCLSKVISWAHPEAKTNRGNDPLDSTSLVHSSIMSFAHN